MTIVQQSIAILMGLFLVCIIAGSFFARSALLSLEQQHKADLVTIVGRMSLVNLIVPLLTALVYAIVVIGDSQALPLATVIAFAVLVVHGIAGAVIADRAYRAHHFPPRFIRLFRLSRAVRIAGSALLFAGILAWMFTRDRA